MTFYLNSPHSSNNLRDGYENLKPFFREVVECSEATPGSYVILTGGITCVILRSELKVQNIGTY